MNRCAFRDFFPDNDDPPAPQEPPQHHTPLSPPRSRKISCGHPSSSSGLRKVQARSSVPVQPLQYRPQIIDKKRTRSADETLRPLAAMSIKPSSPISFRVSKDKTGLMRSNTMAAVDKCPPTTSTSKAQPKNVTSATSPLPAGADLGPHVNVFKNKPKSTPPTCGAHGKRALRGQSSSLRTTPMQPLPEEYPVIPGHPYASTVHAPTRDSFAMRRDSFDTDGRSIISALLDAYCRSEADDAMEPPRKDDASIVFSDDTISLEYASLPSRGHSRVRSASSSTVISQLDDSPKRHKPTSLVITPTPKWDEVSLTFDLASAAQTMPDTRNSRPLPQVPQNQRQHRPLPFPPPPPPYSSPVRSSSVTPPLTTCSQSSESSSSATSSPSSSGSTTITPVSSPPPTSPSNLKTDRPSSQPNISKRPFLAPIVTYSNSSLGPAYPSPLTPDIPLPPSPNTAKLHQASKLSKMLGEQITPDLLSWRQAPTRPTTRASKLSKMLGEDITPDLLRGRQGPSRPPNQTQASKLTKMLGEDITPDLLTPQPSTQLLLLNPRSDSLNYAGRKAVDNKHVEQTQIIQPHSAPASTSRHIEALNAAARQRSRAVRPQAIYLSSDAQETHEQSLSAVNEETESVVDSFANGAKTRRSNDIQVQVDPAVDDEEAEEDHKSLSSTSGLTVGSDSSSLSESLLEELSDVEEAHIGWALQNVITYQKASRVKRTSRMWVLEKDGQKWEEQQTYADLRRALGQI